MSSSFSLEDDSGHCHFAFLGSDQPTYGFRLGFRIVFDNSYWTSSKKSGFDR